MKLKTKIISPVLLCFTISLFLPMLVWADNTVNLGTITPSGTYSTAQPTVTNPAATSGGIVPCGNGAKSPCTLCHLIKGFSNLVQWGLNIVIVAAIVAISIAGIMYIVSAGSEKLMSQAKAFAQASAVGFAIVIAAWLIVNVVIQVLGFSGGKFSITSWNSFSCSTSSTALQGGTSSSSTGTSSSPSTSNPQQTQNQTYCQNTCNASGYTGSDLTKCLSDCTAIK